MHVPPAASLAALGAAGGPVAVGGPVAAVPGPVAVAAAASPAAAVSPAVAGPSEAVGNVWRAAPC
eukprot:4302042-Lingulodinium_polyedra.AAC.1